MRIGIIRGRYTPFGGAEVFLTRFIAELTRQGHSVEVFSSDWPPSKGVTVRTVKSFGPSFLRPLVFALSAERAVKKAAPDVVISLERTACQEIFRAGDGVHKEWLIKRKRTASLLKRALITLSPLHCIMLFLEKRLFSSPGLKTVVANSGMVKNEIIRHYGLPEKRICVIYNGIERTAVLEGKRRLEARQGIREGLKIADDEGLLLFVGSGFERKGLIYLVRAVAALYSGGAKVKLLVVGKGSERRYAKEADRLGIAGRVIFNGPSGDVGRFYAAGDIFCLPSIYEPFSNACLEAMANGVPVITTKANGACEIITNGVDGAVIEDPVDHCALANAIRPFLDPLKREKAATSAKNTAHQYSIEKTVSAFLKLTGDRQKKDNGKIP